MVPARRKAFLSCGLGHGRRADRTLEPKCPPECVEIPEDVPMNDDLIRQDAVTIVGRLKGGEITPHDLLDALEKRIAAVDGAVNALPTLCFDRARQHADRLMRKPVAERGRLAGMPLSIKDLVDVAGVRSTQGSPIYAKHIADKSD